MHVAFQALHFDSIMDISAQISISFDGFYAIYDQLLHLSGEIQGTANQGVWTENSYKTDKFCDI